MSCRIALWDCFSVTKLGQKFRFPKKPHSALRYNTDPVSGATVNEAILAGMEGRGVVNREL